jgi:hypothetical protein
MSPQTFILIFIVFMLAILTRMLYNYFKFKYQKPFVVLMKGTQSIDKDFEKIVSSNDFILPDIKSGDELGITFAFKIFIENTMENRNWGRRFDQLKTIIKYSPNVYYHPLENYLSFDVELKDNVQFASTQSIKYDNPPLQTWLSIVVVFSSNRIQVYSNNELVVNKKLKNPPIFKTKDLLIGEKNNNFFGELGPVLYWGYPLKPNEISSASYELEFY